MMYLNLSVCMSVGLYIHNECNAVVFEDMFL